MLPQLLVSRWHTIQKRNPKQELKNRYWIPVRVIFRHGKAELLMNNEAVQLIQKLGSQKVCSLWVVDVSDPSTRTPAAATSRRGRQRRRRVNCVVSSWSNWTPCPTLCDTDVTWTTRQRHIIRHSEQGGRGCPRRLHRRRRCQSPEHCGTYTRSQQSLKNVNSHWL